jgi:hypothetical protein
LESGLRVKVASVTYFPPYGEGVNSRRAVLGSAGRGGRGWLKGGELEGEDVASGTEEAKAE